MPVPVLAAPSLLYLTPLTAPNFLSALDLAALPPVLSSLEDPVKCLRCLPTPVSALLSLNRTSGALQGPSTIP